MKAMAISQDDIASPKEDTKQQNNSVQLKNFSSPFKAKHN